MRIFSTLLVLFVSTIIAFAGDGYNIKVKINGFAKDSIYLGYYYGDKQFLRDTAVRDAKGWFVFSGEKPLDGGMYLVVMPPDNKFFEILIDENEQTFEVETNFENPTEGIKIKGSIQNKVFYDYLNFIGSMRPRAEEINNKKEAAAGDENAVKQLDEELKKLNEEVVDKQKKILVEHPSSMPSVIIKSNQAPEMPQFEGTEDEVNVKKWRWMLEHYFDNMDLKDDRLVKTSFLFQKINYYLEKLTVQNPDSLNKSIDFILEKMDPNGENFKFYLVHFLNQYAKSKIVGMDGVYVHLVQKYYKTGMATWTPDTTLAKIVENADELEPTLIGKIAPDIMMEAEDGSKVNLHGIKSPYTVLYIWDPDCGHCKKAVPFMIEFNEKFKDKGVTMFSVCSKFTSDVPKCWEDIKTKGYDIFQYNLVDPYHRSKYKIKYAIKSTPQVFILDKDKKIIMKKIGAEQMVEVMDQIISEDQKRMEKGK